MPKTIKREDIDKLERVEFTCHGGNAPAYGCYTPGDQTSTYLRLRDVLGLFQDEPDPKPFDYKSLVARCLTCEYGRKVAWGPSRASCRYHLHPGLMGGAGTEWALHCTDYIQRKG